MLKVSEKSRNANF